MGICCRRVSSPGPTPWLDGKHSIFGRVCNGMKTVQRMGCVETDKLDKPVANIKIIKAGPRLAIANE